MNKSLAAFMGMAAIVIIMITLIFGVAYNALEKKNNQQVNNLKTENQIQTK